MSGGGLSAVATSVAGVSGASDLETSRLRGDCCRSEKLVQTRLECEEEGVGDTAPGGNADITPQSVGRERQTPQCTG